MGHLRFLQDIRLNTLVFRSLTKMRSSIPIVKNFCEGKLLLDSAAERA